MTAFYIVYAIKSKSTGSLRSIKGAMAWDSRYRAIRALKQDCKKCGENFDDEFRNYDLVEMKLSVLDK